MAGLASPGIGSGLDINGLIDKLMDSERTPLLSLAKKESTLQAKISAFGSIKSGISALQSAAQKLTKADTFTASSATVSDKDVLSAKTGANVAPGNYNIDVTQLAKNHVIRSDVDYAAKDTFNAGTLTLSVAGKSKTIDIEAGKNDTLTGIAKSINEAKAGVSAAVINTGSTQRLVLTSTEMGSEGAISLSVNETGSGATHSLTNFAYAGTDTGSMLESQAADDAVFSINNIQITRSSNSVDDAIDGLTLNLTKVGQSNVAVALDSAPTTSAIEGFVKAYNDVVTTLKNLTAYDAETRRASTLTGDSTVRSLEFQLSSLSSSVVGDISGDTARLSDIGISRQLDGTLKVDSNKLKAALADPNRDVMGFFNSTEVGQEGMAVRFDNALGSLLGEGGSLSSRTDGLSNSVKDIDRQRVAINRRLETVEAGYRKQFQALDSLITSMSQTNMYLSQQLNSIAAMTNGGR